MAVARATTRPPERFHAPGPVDVPPVSRAATPDRDAGVMDGAAMRRRGHAVDPAFASLLASTAEAAMHDLVGVATLALGLALLPCAALRAADLPRADEAADYLAPALTADIHPQWTAVHRREAAVWGESLVWPAVTLGAVFDSNPFHAHRGGRAALGTLIAPSLLSETASGVHRTQIYGAADARLFPRDGNADTLEGRAGVLHDWAMAPDLTVRAQGEVARRTDPFDNTQLIAATAREGLFAQSIALGTASVQKTFSRVFVVLSGTALHSRIDVSGGSAATRKAVSDENVETVRARAGVWVAPSAYLFAEPGADWRKLDAVRRGSDGTRVVTGLGVTRLGLLSGELYAGEQQQTYPVRPGAVSTAVYGGRLSWSATPAWTVVAQLDRTLGDVAIATVADGVGTPTEESTAVCSIAYAPTPLWRARASFGGVWIDYLGTPRRDTLAIADLRLDYALSRSFDLTGAVRLTDLHSTFAAASYQRADATLGATYHY